MRDQQDHQETQKARGSETSTKDRERKHHRYDTRNDGDADNPQICRGID
jgi:hypothetical protein